MFFKFLFGCLILASLLIVGGVIVVREKTQMKSRGNYLEKHFERYINYQLGLGRALSAVTDLLAVYPGLRQALGRAAASSPTPTPTPAPAPSATPPAKPPRRGRSVAKTASAVFKVLSGKNALRPDLFLVFDRKKKIRWKNARATVKPEDLRELEAVTRVVGGQAFFNKVMIHRGAALQVSGVPIKNASDEVIGGIIIGVDLHRYMLQYKQQSDTREHMRHRLSLVYKKKVIASVMPKKMWPELSRQLDKRHWEHRLEGKVKRAVIALRKGDYDFYVRPIEGFAGFKTGNIAELFLMRSRRNLKGRGSKVPWGSIYIGVGLSLVIAFLLARWITRPIKGFVKQSQQMLVGETDLTQRIELSSRDETQDLAENINEVFGRLYHLASNVQGAAFQVGASSAEISAASRQMLDGLKDQTLKIEGSTTAVTELSASIQQVAANATEATKVAEKSNEAVTSAQERMQQIRSAVELAADKMQELGDSSKRIGNIVEVIRQISEQTSLLALNASIEAAHAGEQGRGFAVVAEEVSSLALRVGQSAKDIEALIQTIKEQTAEAVSSMDVGTREVESGADLVTNTLLDLKQLIAVVNDTAASVQEQAMVSDEIARNMDAVRRIAGEVLNGSEESVAQAEQLHQLAFALEESVGGFNINSGGASTPAAPQFDDGSRALKAKTSEDA